MKRSLLQTVVLATIGLAAIWPLKADEYNRKTVITIDQPLEVPGVVLAPGTYVMKLFNSSSDRHIVQIMDQDQKQQLALTFAVAANRVRPTGKTVLTMYEGTREAPPALRTWFYPGDVVGQEFLYPHTQAVRISERTNTAVPEVETAGAASAKEAATAVTPAAEENVLVARAEPAPAPIAAPEPVAAPEPQQPAAEPQAPAANDTQAPPAAAAATSDDESLPKTASNGPLAALIGGLSLLLAFGIRKVKRNRV